MLKKTLVFLCFIIFCNAFSDNNHFKSGVSFFKSRDYQKAIENLQKALGQNSSEIVAHYYLGTSFFHLKKNSEAAFHLNYYLSNTELKDASLFRESLNNLFAAYRAEKEWDNIIKAGKTLSQRIEGIKAFARFDPMIKNAMANACISKGNNLYWEKNYTEAKNCFGEALILNPQSNNILERLGMVNFFLGLYEETEKNLTAYLESNVKSWRAISSSAYYLSKITENTSPLAEKIKAKNSLAADILNIYSLFKNGFYDKGFEAAVKAEKEQNTNGDIVMDIINRMQRETDEPEELFIRYIKNYPLSSQVNWMSRRILVLAKNKDKTDEMKAELEKSLKTIIEEVPENRKAEYEMLLMEIRFDSPPEETEEFLMEKIESYLAFASKYPGSEAAKKVLFESAMIYANRLENDVKAAEILKQLEEKENYRNAAVELAKIYSRRKDYDKAIVLLRKIIAEQPQNENVKMMLGESLLNSGDCDEGIKILRELESGTKNQHMRNSLENTLDSYTEIYPKIETGTADFVYIEATRSEIYFSTSADMDRNSPALGQEMFSVSVYPFSMEKNFLPFTLEIFSKNRPSITEPYAVYETRGENAYAARWQSETVACQDRWRHKNPFSMIYPWKETSPENMQIRRNCTVGENELTAEIEILLPSEGWDININCPSYSVKKEGISPAPDASGSSFVLYRNRGGEMGIRISYPKRLDIAGYYPEVVLKKKSITENRIIKTESGAMVSEDFSLQTEKIIETVVLAEVMEKKSAWLKRLTGDEKH